MANRQWVKLLYFQSHQSCLIPWPTGSGWHCFISSLINCVSSHDQQGVSDTTLFPISSIMSHPNQQYVSDTTLFFCLAVSSTMSHPMTNREWVTLLYLITYAHPMTNSMWGTMLYFFASLQLITVSHPMINRMWVTLLLHFFARHSYQSCLIPWPTVCEWHYFISLLAGSLISHVSSHDQQQVSGTALFLCQVVLALIMSYQAVSDTALLLCQAVSPIMSLFLCPPWWFTWPSHCDQQIVSLMKFSVKQLHCLILWPTVSEWHPIFPSHFSYDNKQEVCHNAFVFCQTDIIPWWPTGCVWYNYLLITLHLIV